MPKKEREFFDPLSATDIPWRAVQGDSAGLQEKILSGDPKTGNYTRLLKFPPGADTSEAGPLRHEFWEEVWILEGSIHDIRAAAGIDAKSIAAAAETLVGATAQAGRAP